MDGWRDGGRLQTKEEGEEERRRDVGWWDPAPPQGGGATARKVCGFGFEKQMKEKQKKDRRASCGRHGDGGLTCPHRGAFVLSSRPLTPPRRRHNGAPSLAHVRAHAGPLGSNPPTVSCRLPPPPPLPSSPPSHAWSPAGVRLGAGHMTWARAHLSHRASCNVRAPQPCVGLRRQKNSTIICIMVPFCPRRTCFLLLINKGGGVNAAVSMATPHLLNTGIIAPSLSARMLALALV